MAHTGDISIRPVQPGDYPALLALSQRLTTGAAPWRDRGKFAAAARRWIESSLASAGCDGHAVLVAVLHRQVAGLVEDIRLTKAVRPHR